MTGYTGNRDDLSIGLDMPMLNSPVAIYQKYEVANLHRSATQTITKSQSSTPAPESKPITKVYHPSAVYAKCFNAEGRVTVEEIWRPSEEKFDVRKMDSGAVARLVKKCRGLRDQRKAKKEGKKEAAAWVKEREEDFVQACAREDEKKDMK